MEYFRPDSIELGSLIEYTTDLVFVLDKKARFKYISPSVKRIIGYTQKEMIGDSGFDYVHPEDLPELKKEFFKVVRDPEYIGNVEYRAKKKDGGWECIEVRGRNESDNPDINGILGIGRDITKRKEKERELERKNKYLGDFASFISHELRNPLNIAQVNLELLETKNQEIKTKIDRSLQRMTNMIDRILIYTRTGQDIEKTTDIDIDVIAKKSWNNLLIDDAELDVKDNIVLDGDNNMLMHLFENLFKNAVENGATTIELGKIENGFYISDNGPGIPKDKREKVFDLGYSDENGSGLGLALVDQIIRGHNWDISIKESKYDGAKFEIKNT